MAASAVGRAEFGPAAGGIDGAAKPLGIDEGFDDQHGMVVAGLPIGAEALEGEGEHAGSEVRDGVQDEKAAVVDDQRAAAVALGAGPTDPGVAVFEMLGRVRESARSMLQSRLHAPDRPRREGPKIWKGGSYGKVRFRPAAIFDCL